MKKILSIVMVLAIAIIGVFISNEAYAVTEPVYDPAFNSNGGAFYANGNSITITKNAENNTVINWEGGSQIVQSTVYIFGGGQEGTTFDQANIVMQDGTVSSIYGGGKSFVETSIATVNNSNVTINGGTVLTTVYGGGLIYSTVDDANVIINGGIINGVAGGGSASKVIDGIEYAGGTEENSQNSLTRVNNANVTVNGGIIDSTPSNYGLLYGGGQGYSYTGAVDLNINGGDMSKAYVTCGSANGYTESVETDIKGGKIMLLQTVNRGTLNDADVTISGGDITNAYVGAETSAPNTTGKINTIEYNVLGGDIANLEQGKSDSQPIVIDEDKYKVVMVKGTVENSTMSEIVPEISYEFSVVERNVSLLPNEEYQLRTNLKTTPSGYEDLFETEEINWSCNDEKIATINNGMIKAVAQGNATITAEFLEKSSTTNVNVASSSQQTIIIILFIVLALLVLGIIIYF